MKIKELLSRYNAGYNLLRNQLKQIPPEVICYKPAPDAWSICEIIVHLADSEAHGFIRAKKAIAECGTKVCVYDPRVWAETLHYDHIRYQDALSMIKVLRKNLYMLLRVMDIDKWQNYIYHPESGKIILPELIQLNIDHFDVHMKQIDRIYSDWRKSNIKELV